MKTSRQADQAGRDVSYRKGFRSAPAKNAGRDVSCTLLRSQGKPEESQRGIAEFDEALAFERGPTLGRE